MKRHVPSSMRPRLRSQRGFTLLELMVVLTLIAILSAAVSMSLRDGTQERLERDAQRLAALFDSARALSRITGVPVYWRAQPGGFSWAGVPASSELAQTANWLDPDTTALSASANDAGAVVLQLGPEPIGAPQELVLHSISQPNQHIRLASDGLRPFGIAVNEP